MITCFRFKQIEVYIERRSVPRKGLFQIANNDKSEMFVDFLWWSIIISDLQKVAAYFKENPDGARHEDQNEGGYHKAA